MIKERLNKRTDISAIMELCRRPPADYRACHVVNSGVAWEVASL